MDARLLYPNKYIGAADLRGRDVTMTIDSVIVEDLKTSRGSEEKPIVRFAELANRGKNKPHLWVMNKTNAMQIAGVLGSYEVDDWIGRRITLYPTQCEAFGETVDCVRVRPTAPPQKRGSQQEPPPEVDDSDDWPGDDMGLPQ